MNLFYILLWNHNVTSQIVRAYEVFFFFYFQNQKKYHNQCRIAPNSGKKTSQRQSRKIYRTLNEKTAVVPLYWSRIKAELKLYWSGISYWCRIHGSIARDLESTAYQNEADTQQWCRSEAKRGGLYCHPKIWYILIKLNVWIFLNTPQLCSL